MSRPAPLMGIFAAVAMTLVAAAFIFLGVR